MKKVIYLFLAICLLLTAIPFVGYATETDEEQAAAGKVCKIGDVYYDTLDAAFAAVTDGQTVTMISDYAQQKSISIPAGITVTLDGNGHTLSRAENTTNSDGTLLGNLKANLILDNFKYQSPNHLTGWGVNQLIGQVLPTGDSITVTVKNSEINLGCAFVGGALTDGKTLNIKLENSTVTIDAAKGDAFINNDYTKGQTVNLELDHSTLHLNGNGKLWSIASGTGNLILRNGSVLNSTGGQNMINGWGNSTTKHNVELYSSQIQMTDAGGNINGNQSMPFQWTGGEYTLKLDGQSAIKTVRTNANTGATNGAYIMRVQQNSNVNIALEKGAVIEMADNCGAAGKNSFIMFDGGGTVTLDDKGAEWKIGADLLKKGFVLPDVKPMLGWATTGKLYAAGAGVQVEQATDGMTLQTIFFNDSDFDMVTGAATRTKDPYGLRFNAWVSTDFYNKLNSFGVTVEMGFVIAETEKVIGAFNLDAMAAFDYENCKFEQTPTEADGKISFWKALYDFSDDKESLSKQYSAMAYLKLQFADGSTHTIYTIYDAASHARSVYDVAQKAVEAGMTNDLLLHIISVAEA